MKSRRRSALRRVPAPALAAVLAFSLSACFLAGTPAPAPSDLRALEAQVNARPADTDAALRLAAAYRAAGRLDDARVLLERTVANAPRGEGAILLLGVTYEELGRLPDARAFYARYDSDGYPPSLRDLARGRLAVVERLELRQAAKDAVAREGALSSTPPVPRTVAVFPFVLQGGDDRLRPLSRALAEMLTTDLAQTDRLTPLERARVQALLDEAALTAGGLAEPGTAVRGGRLLGAANVVQGRIGGAAGIDGALRLDAQLVSVGAEGMRPALSRQTDARLVLDAEKALALDLYDQLGVQLTAAERERVQRRPTQNLQALLAFGLGLERQDAGDFAAAAAAFRRAAALDPAFAA
ncbi:MAG: hypothetical protein JWM27_4329, partial [Gemmatimonadetes bacterium]|nr:hypothetical protein [Gemmatimonadota bacterium]